MPKINNILTNGCSFSCGPVGWPYPLQKKLDCNLINLAVSASGNRYIHDSTIRELSKRQYDYVFIMWSGLQRNDIQVDNIEIFNDAVNSRNQSGENDWKDKIVYPVNDQDLIEKNWVFVALDNPFLKRTRFCEYIKYRGFKIEVQDSLMYMITLQSVLKQLNIPYVFSFYMDYLETLKTNKELFAMLDLNNICLDGNINEIAREINSYNGDGFHPGVEANQIWADNLIKFINAETE